VDKNSFIQVLNHFSESSVQEAQEVLLLKDDYPYSQVLHALSARVSKDHGFSTHSDELQKAAVYAADRGVLKEIMLHEHNPDLETPLAIFIKPEAVKTEVKKAVNIKEPDPVVADISSSDIADEVLHDLERLDELKHNFEMLFVDGGTTSIKPIAPEPVDASEETRRDSTKSKKERIIELAKALESSKAETEEVQDTNKLKFRRKRKNDGEELIEEIASSKQQLEPESEKQKEQIEIIDQFIKIQPTIANSKDKPLPLPAGDLSTSKAGEFGDNIVSETLVEILVKQGKKDKAIEVLKKLIWKFPQKKAYFAAQIEDLRK
jgi:hypothetical protein